MDYFPNERCLEDAIWKMAKDTNVNPISGDRIFGMLRQPRMGELGICDMAFVNKLHDGLHLQLVELKNKKLSIQHVAQTSRYLMFANLHAGKSQIKSINATLVTQRTDISKDIYWLAYAAGIELVFFDFDNGQLVFEGADIELPDYSTSKNEMETILSSMGVQIVR